MKIIDTKNPNSITLACEALSRGELVIYPTETCYGVAADGTNADAVSRLLAYKGDRHRQVSIAVTDRPMAEHYVEINEMANNLYVHFLPGPITVISKSLHHVDERLESATGTLGVRIPRCPLALDLIKKFGKPVTATSANTSGKKEPYSLADWQKYTTKEKQATVGLFLDAGRLADRPTSTVVDTTLNEPVVLRQGEIIVPSVAGQSFTSHSTNETREIGFAILHRHMNVLHKYPLLIALQGELGAGKTQLGKGFAAELGVRENVASPTYMLMHEYPYRTEKQKGVFYHIDTWRLDDSKEVESTLHLSELLKPGNIVAVEWIQKAASLLDTYKNDIAIILINIQELDENTRQIDYTFSSPEWS